MHFGNKNRPRPKQQTEFPNPYNKEFATNFYNNPDPGAASFFEQMFMKSGGVENIGGSIQFANGVTTFEKTI